MADSTGLTGNAAAVNGSLDVDLADGAGGDQGLANDELKSFETEVVVNITAVDGDSTGAVGDQVNTSDRMLSASGTVHIGSFALISCHYCLPPINDPKLRASGLHGHARDLRKLSGA